MITTPDCIVYIISMLTKTLILLKKLRICVSNHEMKVFKVKEFHGKILYKEIIYTHKVFFLNLECTKTK